MIARVLVPLALLLASCSAGDEEPSARHDGTGEPRGPRGQGPARCEGASADPPELDAIAVRAERDLEGAIVALEALAGAHPGSATARARLGELSLRTGPPRAEQAERWFARALALHEAGCTLAYRDRWASLEGSALARMMRGDYEGAIPFLRRSLDEWPNVRSTRYNFACALCRTGDLDGCGRELRAVLDAEGTPGPSWLGEQRRPPGHYARRAREDPDLAPLRADPDRFERATGLPLGPR